MSHRTLAGSAVLALVVSLAFACAPHSTSQPPSQAAVDVLPSWNDTAVRSAIVDFVERVTDPASPDFVPGPERIAVFDNDGTLWAEQPAYFQLLFAIDRVKSLAGEHPDWATRQPFQAVLEGDMEALAAAGHHGLLELVMATHAGMTTAEFETVVGDWLATARHPTTGKPYTEMVYQPMLELLDHLRDNGFKTFIVSGGGIEFMRPWTEQVYGIPPEQVVGSSIKTAYEVRNGVPVLVRQAELDFIDDKEGKPVGINAHIGRRPIAAVGNSDGDFQMLEWTTAGDGARLGVLVHHTDAEREWAYDRDSHIGRLDRGLDEAADRGWVVVDMKTDWKAVFPGR
ncbi:MAG: haloacid dehalogenase-like hydrolase [Thermoanaerobaculales bacterium]|jgi:phosphoglycolate phosphatase-like HAD superfamily hydrolase|nr:haloacid dehalogenase-like hydrolase [Thermoanaerobaculales bacterium]